MRRTASMLAGLAVATAAVGLTAAPAHAAPGTVDGTIAVMGITCTFADAVTSDTPPNTLTIDGGTLNPACPDGVQVTVDNSPSVTFDDAAGTATSPEILVSADASIMSCSYRVSNITLDRDGTTRTYSGGGFSASKTGGSFLCPSSVTIDTATFAF